MLTGIFNFTTDRFHFLPSVTITCLQFVWVVFCRSMYWNESVTSQVIISMLNNMVVQAFSCWIIHMALNKFGSYLMLAEILKNGNEKLLNNLEEGVII